MSDSKEIPSQNSGLLGFLLKRPSPSKTADRAAMILFPLLIGLSIWVLTHETYEMPVSLCLAVIAAVDGLLIWFKTYKTVLQAPLSAVLIPTAFTAHMMFWFPGYIMIKPFVLSRVAVGTLVFLIILAFTGAIISKIDVKYTDKKRFIPALLTTAPLMFTVYLYMPSQVYLTNRYDFAYAYQDMIVIPAVYFVIITLCLALNVCLLGKLFFKIYSALALGLTVCTFVQDMFLNNALPIMLGNSVDWSLFTTEKIVSSVVWCVIIAAALFAVLKFGDSVPEIRFGTVLLPSLIGIFEVVMIVILMISAGSSAFKYQQATLTNQDQFAVSGKTNLIIFVLDESDDFVYEELYERDPEKFETLKDFTYYDNFSTVYDSTYFSVPQLITGTTLIPETGLDEWYDRIFTSDQHKGFFKLLKENNYKINIYGKFMFDERYERIEDITDNMRKVDSGDIMVNHMSINKNIMRFSRYKYMPYILKEKFEPTTGDVGISISTTDLPVHIVSEFMHLSSHMTADEGDQNYFILQHLNGIHDPLETGSKVSEAALCLDMLEQYFSELKRLGVYDDSMIIVTADHGLHYEYAAMPIFYIKEPGHTGEKMQVNSAPIYMPDVFSTCLVNAGLYDKEVHESLFGNSIYDFHEGDERTRLWFARDGFPVKGTVGLKKQTAVNNRVFGYYFTGDRYELKRVTIENDPDYTIHLNTPY